MKYFTFILFSISIATAQLVKPVENDSVGFQDPLIEQIDSTLSLIIENGMTKLKNGLQWNRTYQWDASPLTSGVYFIRLESGSFSQSQKLILVK